MATASHFLTPEAHCGMGFSLQMRNEANASQLPSQDRRSASRSLYQLNAVPP
jgi:hypothetical protein